MGFLKLPFVFMFTGLNPRTKKRRWWLPLVNWPLVIAVGVILGSLQFLAAVGLTDWYYSTIASARYVTGVYIAMFMAISLFLMVVVTRRLTYWRGIFIAPIAEAQFYVMLIDGANDAEGKYGQAFDVIGSWQRAIELHATTGLVWPEHPVSFVITVVMMWFVSIFADTHN